MTTIELRTVDETLLAQIVELDQLCFGGLWSIDGYQREIDSPNSELIALTIDNNQLIGLGCFWAILDEAHITIVAVHPDYRRRGLGQLIVFALLDRAGQRDLKRATLEVRISNQSAVTLYKNFQFSIAGQRKGYYTDTGEDALILWRGELQTLAFKNDLKARWRQIVDRLAQQQWALRDPQTLLSIEKTTLTY